MSALQTTVRFQVVLFAVQAVRLHWGIGREVLGLTDVDALTISMAKSADGQIPILVAAAEAIGILSNTILKLLLGAAVWGRFRRLTPVWLGIMAVASHCFRCGIALMPSGEVANQATPDGRSVVTGLSCSSFPCAARPGKP